MPELPCFHEHQLKPDLHSILICLWLGLAQWAHFGGIFFFKLLYWFYFDVAQ